MYSIFYHNIIDNLYFIICKLKISQISILKLLKTFIGLHVTINNHGKAPRLSIACFNPNLP